MLCYAVPGAGCCVQGLAVWRLQSWQGLSCFGSAGASHGINIAHVELCDLPYARAFGVHEQSPHLRSERCTEPLTPMSCE